MVSELRRSVRIEPVSLNEPDNVFEFENQGRLDQVCMGAGAVGRFDIGTLIGGRKDEDGQLGEDGLLANPFENLQPFSCKDSTSSPRERLPDNGHPSSNRSS